MKRNETIEAVLNKASSLVNPSNEEREKLEKVEAKIFSRLIDSFAKLRVKPEIKTGGSFAKGTWLPGSGDIDFFLLFPVTYPRENLEGEAILSAKNAVRGYPVNLRYAEHPYVEAFVENTRVNLVPCYKVEKGRWQSAADRSPFHTDYVQSNFSDKLRAETRLLKKFLKVAGVYGAELKVQGFSGYVSEVLILKYGSFESVLTFLSTIKPGDVVALEPYDKNLASMFKSCLVILDPVDSTRNLGSAISTKNVAKAALESRHFLSKPEISYFAQRSKPPKRVDKGLLERTIIILFKTKPRSVDILWGQLYKSLDALGNKIENLDFKILRKKAASNEIDESAFIFLLLETNISKYKIRSGPSAFRGEDIARYLEKNERRAIISYLDQGDVHSIFQRKKGSNDVFPTLKAFLQNRRQRRTIGLSKEVMYEIKNFRIERGTSVFRSHSKKREWLKDAVLEIVSKEL